MKKLFFMAMLLNFAPIALGSDKDLNSDNDLLKKAAYEALTDTAYGAVYVTACTIRAAIPFATVASLTHDAKKTNDISNLKDIQRERFRATVLKSTLAIPLCVAAVVTAEPVLAAFFGAHALSFAGIHCADKFINAKINRLKKEENERKEQLEAEFEKK